MADDGDNQGGFLRGVLGAFVEFEEEPAEQGDSATAPDIGDFSATLAAAEALGGAAKRPATGSPTAATPASKASGKPAVRKKRLLDADLPTIYNRTKVIGDSNTDPLLKAFDALKDQSAEIKQAAMIATIAATSADSGAVIASLEKRVQVLDAAVKKERGDARAHHESRIKEVDDLERRTTTSIKALKKQIAEHEKSLASAQATAKAQDRAETEKVNAFAKRLGEEDARLRTLADFLRSSAPQGKKEQP